MRKIHTLILTLLFGIFCLAASAQDPVKLTVVNSKGKPMNQRAQISLQSNPLYLRLDKSGSITLYPLSADSLLVTVDRYVGSIPYEGQKQITVAVNTNNGKMTDPETGKEYKVYTFPPFNPNDLSTMPDIASYPSLADLILAKFPKVELKGQDAYLKANQALTTTGAMPPMLVVVDGVKYPNFGRADGTVVVREVKSIVIKREDVLYGMLGAGGIIEITLKKGGD